MRGASTSTEEAFIEGDSAVEADADNDDDEPSSWKKLGMGKVFGKKKTNRRKKYGKNAANGGGHGGKADAAGANGEGGHEMDSSINTSNYSPDAVQKEKQRRPTRHRAKAALPAKNPDHSESDSHTERGLEPMDAAMESAALPQHWQTQRKHHTNTRRSSGGLDPPTAATISPSQARRQRRKKKVVGDGYENSGHETSDFMFTEDDKTDFLETDNDKDNDDQDNNAASTPQSTSQRKICKYYAARNRLCLYGKKCKFSHGVQSQNWEVSPVELSFGSVAGAEGDSSPKSGADNGDGDDGNKDLMTELNAATQQLSLGKDDSNSPPGDEGEKSPKDHGDEEKAPPSDGKLPQTPQSNATTPSSLKKKRPRKRTSKSKKTQQTPPQTVPEDPPISMQEAEELDCHTPMKTTLRQQQQQQTPKKPVRQQKASDKQSQPVIEEKEHDPHEDEDDYPSSMLCQMVTPTKGEESKEEGGGQKSSSGKKGKKTNLPKRTIEEELSYLKRISSTRYQIQLGFVPNMKVPAEVIVNNDLQTLLVQELRDSCCGPKSQAGSAFVPALRQAANVAALPGIVRASLAMPDVHSGYGFCIGNVAAFDMDDPSAVISPGGVGFDINCGVRLIRTNLTEADVGEKMREELAEAMFRNIPVGVGVGGDVPCNMAELDKLLKDGIDWAIKKGYAWKEDKDHCEENGCMETADPNCVSIRAKKRGLKQIGTLGAGNHYAEIQVVDEIYNPEAAATMGIGTVGQVCIMIHTGSRGLGHQVATDALTVMERAMARDKIELNDRQLSCARISSREGKEYLAAMSAAANFAWVNRSCITYLTRKAFSEVFNREPDDMDMHLIYDVCHNIAKVEKHVVDGVDKTLLVHRKGSTRAFPPKHPNIPKDYQSIGQPVLIGGTMGTCSYVLVGTEKGMTETFGSTCHGAGRALSRNQSRKKLDHNEVLDQLKKNGISIRVASPKLVTEEAPESYKNVCDVIDTCQDAGISKKVVKLRPIAVIKG